MRHYLSETGLQFKMVWVFAQLAHMLHNFGDALLYLNKLPQISTETEQKRAVKSKEGNVVEKTDSSFLHFFPVSHAD